MLTAGLSLVLHEPVYVGGRNRTDVRTNHVSLLREFVYDCVVAGGSWTTRIELPLKDEMRSQTQCRSLAARFHDVHPSLLLFLHRLKHLTVHNTVSVHTTH